MKKHIKIILDIIMTIMAVCLTKIKITGMKGHERLGMIILVLFILHLILNFKWVKTVSRNILSRRITKKQRNSYLVCFILTLSALTAAVTGVLVSVTMLQDISFGNRAVMAIIHKVSALVLFITIIVHIAMHGKYIIDKLKIKN